MVTPIHQAWQQYTDDFYDNEFDFDSAGQSLTLSPGDSPWYGTEDDDFIVGSTGDDVIRALGDSDDLIGRAGNDRIYGGDDKDRIQGMEGNDLLSGGNGDDHLLGGEGNDILNGGFGNDLLLGDGVDQILAGLDTADYSESLSGVTVNLDVANVDTDLGTATGAQIGTDLLGNIENVRGSYTHDHLIGSYVDNVLWGGTGNDWLQGRAGNDKLLGGEDHDLLEGEDGDDQIDGEEGDDDLYGGADNDLIRGGAGADLLSGESGNDMLDGGADADTLSGDQGDDILDGGDGRDVLVGGDGNDSLNGGTFLTDSSDSLYGGAGDDRLFGGAGNDALYGELDLDTLSGGTGNDTYYLRDLTYIPPGPFSASREVYDTVAEGLDGGVDTVVVGRQTGVIVTRTSYTLGANIENGRADGTADFSLIGNELNNTLLGNTGVNTLTGAGGNDRLDGQGGLDALAGGLGNDTYVLGSTSAAPPGTATLYPYVYDTVTEGVNEGVDTVQVQRAAQSSRLDYTAYTLGANIENGEVIGREAFDLVGNELANQLTGNGASNTLSGGNGNDVLNGEAGYDTLVGGAGSDVYVLGGTSAAPNGIASPTPRIYDAVVEGAGGGIDTVQVARAAKSNFADFTSYTLGANIERGTVIGTEAFDLVGNDLDNMLKGNGATNQLAGGSGDDQLTGGLGGDALTLGLGQNVVIYASAAEGGDTITDFRPMDDLFRLDDAGFGPGVGRGTLATAGVTLTLGAAAIEANESLVYNRATGQLFWDGDGTGAGAQVLLASLTTKPALTAGDFTFV